MPPDRGRRLIAGLAASAAMVWLPACHNCANDHFHCRSTASRSQLLRDFSATSVRARLGDLARWVGPAVGGISFNWYGEIWVSLSGTGRLGVSPGGSKLENDPSAGHSPDTDPPWGGSPVAVTLRRVPAAELDKLIAKIQSMDPTGYFQGAELGRSHGFGPPGLVWNVEFLGGSGGLRNYYARGNGADLCLEFSKHLPCRHDIDQAL